MIVHRHYELSIPSSKRNEKIKLRIHCLWRLGTAFINVNKNGHFLICGSEHSARSKSFALYSKKCQSRPWCYAFKYVVIRIYVNINIQWDNSCKVVLSKGKILFKAVNWEKQRFFSGNSRILEFELNHSKEVFFIFCVWPVWIITVLLKRNLLCIIR